MTELFSPTHPHLENQFRNAPSLADARNPDAHGPLLGARGRLGSTRYPAVSARTVAARSWAPEPNRHKGDQVRQQACSTCQQANTFIPDYHHRENTKPIGCWRKTREIQRTRRPCPGKLLHRGASRTARAPHDEGVLCILTQFSNNQSPSLFSVIISVNSSSLLFHTYTVLQF